ncbi:hypothetical protein AGABI2DRAFT_137926 [Agaricus bisporus var. bisporus H97]|uniref:hypothetical protein n=1 Tax=Agaricus bisporus var. bisporus (strain H97 / ATCC MYA-4626 / FGSC 10389) TaxID=936046 RepID=UPI00029F7DB2|nr:hypothetical protein AGABI2DRAFT_137926 [Agaricus bisporus var. bisporus H97]EKV45415.1 hypothetical protein AGABI2DRAFT_137926 [Agaricus bisporus var. bisporus H97]
MIGLKKKYKYMQKSSDKPTSAITKRVLELSAPCLAVGTEVLLPGSRPLLVDLDENSVNGFRICRG